MDAQQLIDLLSTASPFSLFAIFLVSLLKGWIVLPREIDSRDKRIAELLEERDEYKALSYRALNISERIADTREGRL